MNDKTTIYSFAQKEMAEIVSALLELSEQTANFTQPLPEVWQDPFRTDLLLCGKRYAIDDVQHLPSGENAWTQRLAIPFSIESAATGTLYRRIAPFTDNLIAEAFRETNDFTSITADWVVANPQTLPVLMHVAGTFSKQELKKRIGSVSDNAVSKIAAQRLAQLVSEAAQQTAPDPGRIRERIKATVEGIVRDLVGRLLLEEFVATALRKFDVPFKREEQYASLSGVVYDFRADFVVPDEVAPRAFLEVRKSSSRHASLYAKDKMFSAINWKGRHPHCLGVLVIDGPWTDVTLTIMASIFDYVVPIGQVDEVAAKIRAYLHGDRSVLQWLIQFQILRFNADGDPTPAGKVNLGGRALEELRAGEDVGE